MSALGIRFTARPAFRFRLPSFPQLSASFAVLVATAFATPALAVAEIRVPFDQVRQKACNLDVDTCSADFPVVPANSRLEVTSVACSFFTRRVNDDISRVAALDFAILNAAGQVIAHDYAVPVFQAYSHPFGSSFAANNETFFFVPAGGRVRVVMTATVPTGLQLDCKIAGERFDRAIGPTP